VRIYKINIRISYLHRPQLLLPCYRPREINRINPFLSYLFSKKSKLHLVTSDLVVDRVVTDRDIKKEIFLKFEGVVDTSYQLEKQKQGNKI